MNTHETYVSFEIAKLLKEARFDWECNYAYTFSDNEVANKAFLSNWSDTFIDAPTLAVAQKWLREVKRIYIEIVTLENKRCITNSDGWTFHYEYGKPTFDCDIHNERCETISTLDNLFNTYEEAQEAGIKKALEIILEKDDM